MGSCLISDYWGSCRILSQRSWSSSMAVVVLLWVSMKTPLREGQESGFDKVREWREPESFEVSQAAATETIGYESWREKWEVIRTWRRRWWKRLGAIGLTKNWAACTKARPICSGVNNTKVCIKTRDDLIQKIKERSMQPLLVSLKMHIKIKWIT